MISEDCDRLRRPSMPYSDLWSVYNSESIILTYSYELYEFNKPDYQTNHVCSHTYTHDNILDESLLQESILDPALFSICIDIPFGFRMNNKFRIYAHNKRSSARGFASTVVRNVSQIIVHSYILSECYVAEIRPELHEHCIKYPNESHPKLSWAVWVIASPSYLYIHHHIAVWLST
jgi:hypothetical protein